MIEISPYWERDYQGIMDDMQNVTGKELLLFEQVFYPVSVFEITMEEETYEDLEKVQLFILRVCHDIMGEHTPENIGAMLGLSAQYTGKVMKLMHGYGYLEQDPLQVCRLTELGEAALAKEKEIHCAQVKQLVYFDQLNMQPVHLASTFARDVIYKPEAVNRSAVIIPCYAAGMDSEEANQNYLDWFNRYTLVPHKKSILNVNTRKIDDVQCVDRSLIKGYLIRSSSCRQILFITKCYDVTEEKREERIHWRPLALTRSYQKLHQEAYPEALDATAAYQSALEKTFGQIRERDEKRAQKENQKE